MPEPTAPKPGPPPRKPRSGSPAPQTTAPTAPAPAAAPTPATPTASEPAATTKPRRQPAAKVTVIHPQMGQITGTVEEVTALLAATSNIPAAPAPSAPATNAAPATSTGPQDTVPLTQADVDARVAEALERLKREPWHKRARSFVSASIASLLINALLVGLIIGLLALSYYGILGQPIGWPTIILAIVIVVAVKGWSIGTRNKTRAEVLEEINKVNHERGE